MLNDKGKLIYTVLLTVLIFMVVIVCLLTNQGIPEAAWALIGSVSTWVFINGKQLTASGAFIPSPMVVPKPEHLARLIAEEAQHQEGEGVAVLAVKPSPKVDPEPEPEPPHWTGYPAPVLEPEPVHPSTNHVPR